MNQGLPFHLFQALLVMPIEPFLKSYSSWGNIFKIGRGMYMIHMKEPNQFGCNHLGFNHFLQIEEEPVRERQIEEHFSPSLGSSSNSASLTSGSLADISSLSTSKSSSGTPSLTKTSSSSSGGSNLTKTSSISSISRADSSLGKEISSGSSPGSNKTSPNVSKGSATPGSPKLRRSVSFQDEHPERQSPTKGKPGSASTVGERTGLGTTLTRAETLPSPPTEQGPRLTRSSTEVTPRQKDSSSVKSGKKSIFSKTYGSAGKRGLRTRGDKNTGKESRKKVAAGDSAKDSDGEKDQGSKRPQRRQRSRSREKNGAKSPILGTPEQQSLPTTLPTTPFHTEPSAPGLSETGGGTSTSGPSTSLSKSSSSKG